ncbi:nucleotidyltransferase domain-containing protein [Thermoflexus sp.]|uniref:nucleotidyltransferase domain-containing protein n=1 Tax=Thermoflexus sp. TaxID=1969742 RepID=UPI0035E3F9E1
MARSAFTNFASSRLIDREAVLEALPRCAKQLRDRCSEVVAVYLFGSFATGRATPRSDADLVVEIASEDPKLREKVRDQALESSPDAPVPVEIFVQSTRQLEEGKRSGRGVAGAVAREGIHLA